MVTKVGNGSFGEGFSLSLNFGQAGKGYGARGRNEAGQGAGSQGSPVAIATEGGAFSGLLGDLFKLGGQRQSEGQGGRCGGRKGGRASGEGGDARGWRSAAGDGGLNLSLKLTANDGSTSGDSTKVKTEQNAKVEGNGQVKTQSSSNGNEIKDPSTTPATPAPSSPATGSGDIKADVKVSMDGGKGSCNASDASCNAKLSDTKAGDIKSMLKDMLSSDGNISREEFKKAYEQAMKNGMSKEDFKAAVKAALKGPKDSEADKMFDELDGDKNNKLTSGESSPDAAAKDDKNAFKNFALGLAKALGGAEESKECGDCASKSLYDEMAGDDGVLDEKDAEGSSKHKNSLAAFGLAALDALTNKSTKGGSSGKQGVGFSLNLSIS